MWERLTRADLERAKSQLTHSRAEILRRHVDELKTLDAERDQVESLEQLISTLARTYLSSEVPPAEGPAVLSVEQSTASVSAATDGNPDAREQPKAISVDLRVEQQISPSFGAPPRLRRLIGG